MPCGDTSVMYSLQGNITFFCGTQRVKLRRMQWLFFSTQLYGIGTEAFSVQKGLKQHFYENASYKSKRLYTMALFEKQLIHYSFKIFKFHSLKRIFNE